MHNHYQPTWIVGLFIFLHLGLMSQGAYAQASHATSLNRYRALGQAYMEEESFKNAIEMYRQASALVPQSVSDTINLGIAYYHGDRNEDSITTLLQARQQDPRNPFANYTLGLAHKKIGDTTNALFYFQQVADVDATDPATLYNLGLANFNLKKQDEAAQWFHRTLEIDPKHTPSYYNLFLYYARTKKDMVTAKNMMTTFQQLKKSEPDRPADAVDEGKFLGPIEFEIPLDDQLNFTSDLAVQWKHNTALTQSIHDALGSASYHVLAAIPSLKSMTTALVLSTHRKAGQASSPRHGKTAVLIVDSRGQIQSPSHWPGQWDHCAAADYDNDKDIDLFLYSPTASALYRNDGDWKFTHVTAALVLPATGCADAMWCDFDAEGDLDLFLARPGDNDAVYQNNGDGSFKDITSTLTGLAPGQSRAWASADLDNDNDLDLLRYNKQGTLEVFLNDREVTFHKSHSLPIPGVSSETHPTLFPTDINNDGTMDVVVLETESGAPAFYHLDKKEKLESLGLLDPPSGWTITAMADMNNDGFEDALLTHKGNGTEGPSLCAINRYPKPFSLPDLKSQENTNTIPGLLDTSSSPLFTDIDFDGDLDLFAVASGELKVYENTNGNQNHSITLQVEGAKNTTYGLGAKILVKDDLFFMKKEIRSTATHLGIGTRSQVDVIRITWPNGIFQNLIHTPAGTIQSVTEKPGYAGSCPFVYTWNGQRYEFVADSLSTGPLGLYVGGGYFPPRPDEYIRIRGDQLKAKQKTFSIMMREELREITYFDAIGLLSASHPTAQEIHVNECFTVPPHPTFKLIGMSDQARPPLRMTDHHGNDVTDLIRENDHRYPRPWKPSRYDGIGEEHWFELDLGDLRNANHIYLFMTGYVDWPNSSHARSLEQNPSLDFVMPYLQVQNKNHAWETVLNPMGFPAGKLKTVPLDLSHVFKTNDYRIRIVSTLQVHWDRILVDTHPLLDGFTITRHAFQSADLRYGGYARSYVLDGVGPHWYDYTQCFTNTRWDYHRGWFTRFGDVTPLLTEFDDKYIIMQHGDEVALTFDAANLPQERALTYFLHVTGWVKDLDYSTAYSTSVEPLPFKGMSAYPYGKNESYPWDEEHILYFMKYNTRLFTKQNEKLSLPQKIALPQAAPSIPGDSG